MQLTRRARRLDLTEAQSHALEAQSLEEVRKHEEAQRQGSGPLKQDRLITIK